LRSKFAVIHMTAGGIFNDGQAKPAVPGYFVAIKGK
jgi:hypothetical protein